jgi:hypothetical protein
MNPRRFVAAAALLGAACGRPPAAPSREPRFAVELPGSPPWHILVSDGGFSSTPIPFSSLTEISWRAQTTDAPVTLQLDFSAEGNRARIVSYAIYPTRRDKIGDHRARLNESVKLTELQNLGYLPFTLRVLPATPPPRPMPALVSDAPSIRTEVVRRNWDSFTLAVHNLSAHAVVAFAAGQVKTPRDDGYTTTEAPPGRPAIPAGGTVTFEHGGAGPVELRGVLFDDGSWEGDPAIIARIKAERAATQALRAQIDEVAARVLSDTSLDDAARIGRIRAGIDALPEKPSPALIRRALAGLPIHRLSDREQHLLEYDLHNFKWSESDRLSQFQPGRGMTLARYWTATHGSQ